jgi:phosphonate transport system substrate-binding protein
MTIAAGQLGSPEKPLVIAFEPYVDANRTAVAGRALADCLTKLTGLFYQIEVGANAAATIESMGAGRAQIGFLDTTSILQGRAKYDFDTGLIVLRTYKGKLEPFYQRQFIARKALGIKTIADLHGKSFCFGEPSSSFGAIVPRIVLAANGLSPDRDLRAQRFAGYADQVAIAVYKGECDAGATFIDVLTDPNTALNKTFPDILDKVGVFYVTDPIPNDGVQYVKDLDPKLKQATSDALLAMAPEGVGKREPLVTLYKIEGFIKADNNFYQDFERIVKKAGVNPASLVR